MVIASAVPALAVCLCVFHAIPPCQEQASNYKGLTNFAPCFSMHRGVLCLCCCHALMLENTMSIQCSHAAHFLSCTADTYRKNDVLSIQENIVNHVEYTLARIRNQFDDLECYQAVAYSLRDRLIELWNDTQTHLK